VDPLVIADFLATWGYLALLALLLLTGIGSPLPEDLLLLIAGYLVYAGTMSWLPALAVAMTGVVGSDMVLYAAGRHLVWRPRASLEGRVLSPGRLRRVTWLFDRIGASAVFVARLIPGTRALVFVTAGVRGLPASRFLAADVLGALLWVPFLLIVGHRFGPHIGSLSEFAAWTERGALWLAGAGLILFTLWLLLGREESKL
jgi:membrane protein DedA with SNARE-associated domain